MPSPQETAEGLLNTAAEFLKYGHDNLRYALLVLETMEMELRRTPQAYDKSAGAAVKETSDALRATPPCN